MDTKIILCFLVLMAAVCLVIGFRSYSLSKDFEEYFLGGRKLGTFALSMTLVATQVGGGTILGAADEAYLRGWIVLCYPLGVSFGFLLLALGFGAALRKKELSTVAEIFEVSYNAPFLRKIASLLSIFSLFIVLIGLGIASRKFFFSIGMSNPSIFFVFWMVVVTYTVMGGLEAVVKTDIAQTFFIIISFILTALVGFSTQVPLREVAVPVSVEPTPWISWLLMPLLFMLIEQDMGQRCFAAKSPKTVTKAAFLAALTLFSCCFVPIAFGIKAQKMGLTVATGESVLLKVVAETCGPVLSGMFSCAVLLAIVSTVDSLLCSVSSNLACDFEQVRKRGGQSARLVTFCVGILAFAGSFLFSNVIGLFMIAYELSVSVLTVAVVMAIVKKNPNRESAIVSMVVGALGFVVFQFIAIPLPAIVVTLSCSLFAAFLSDTRGRKTLLLEEVK